MLPANETPPITNAEPSVVRHVDDHVCHDEGRVGQHHQRDRHGRRHAAGVPSRFDDHARPIFTPAPTGVKGGVLIPFPPGTVTLTNGSGTFTATGDSGADGGSGHGHPEQSGRLLLQRAHGAEWRRRDARAVGENAVAFR